MVNPPTRMQPHLCTSDTSWLRYYKEVPSQSDGVGVAIQSLHYHQIDRLLQKNIIWNNNNLFLFYPSFPYFEFPPPPPLANSVLQSVAAQLWIKKGGGILSRWSELWTLILLFNIMLSDRQDNGRVGDWHKHEDKRVGCYTGNSLWWIMTTLQNVFFLFFHLRLYDSFLLLFKDKE